MSNADALSKQLESARRDLLELSTRNRLLHTPRDQASGLSLEIKDELAEQIFQLLVNDQSAMRFEQGELVEISVKKAKKEKDKDEDAATPDDKPKKVRKTTVRVTKKAAQGLLLESNLPPGPLPMPTPPTIEETPSSTSSPSAPPKDRHTDNVLHTELEPEELDRRLLGLVTDAKASIEEQGVNILYLVLGFVKWFDEAKPDTPRFAPLILIPVKLERQNAGTRYQLVYTGDDIETNLTLKARLKLEGGMALPEVPDIETLSPTAYFAEVSKAIAGQKNWEVLANDMVLWFFSFTKLLMYRDLDPDNWPDQCHLLDRPMIRALLTEGFPSVAPLIADDKPIDTLFEPAQTAHIIDCDSSQALVIEEAKRGRSLIIQGPPGTGKSQTITNLIAAAVRSGKTVLFMAEKMAALEVVKRRLDKIGLGDMCLELHSEKASKKVVLQDVEQTLKLGKPKLPAELSDVVNRLKGTRDQLNRQVDVMHSPMPPSGLTAYQVLTELIDIRCSQQQLPDFQLTGAENWTIEQYKGFNEQVKDYTFALKDLASPPNQHPWRGCQLVQVLPIDLERIVASIPPILTQIDQAGTSALALSQRVGVEGPTSLAQIGRLFRTVRGVLGAPPIDPVAHASSLWSEQRQAFKTLADHARSILLAKEKLKDVVTDAAWDTDVAEARQAYAEHGGSIFRMFHANYRQARRILRSLMQKPIPSTFEERREILDLLNARQKGIKELTEAGELGSKGFGKVWLGKQTDWKQIDAIETWDNVTMQLDPAPNFRSMLGLITDRDTISRLADQLEKQLTSLLSDLKKLFDTLELDLKAAFLKEGTPFAGASTVDVGLQKLGSAGNETLSDLRGRIESWNKQPERLQHWRRYVTLRGDVQKIAAGTFASAIDAGKIANAEIPIAFQFSYYEAILRRMMKDQPELVNFEGGKFQRLIEDFCQLDQTRITLARNEIAETHYANIGKPRGAGMTDGVALLRQEMQKKRRHLPLRTLLHRAGTAVQAVKPVFMMSPLSVAQFLEPGILEFDLLMIDEASQVRPVEALGAAARCKQMIVVGDDKQMPPTQFFSTVVGDSPEEDNSDGSIEAGDVESILSLCMARNMPQRMLRWHYRSRHHTLIAVSNREFYNNQLYIIPSPERSGELGLKFHFIEGGKYINRVNPTEAQVVAQAVLDHAKKHPNWTLGVGTFSMTQRDLVLKEIEKLRRSQPETESFFDPNAPDPFFVKNLENIQGDERDVIYVSVGYGPDENGKVSLNFGPVSASGGERRLNVLMTRAKRRCEMFSSIHAEDLDLSRATGRGPATFRAFLQFAQSGGQIDSTSGVGQDRLPEVIAKLLKQKGYDSKTQVGIAGLYLDLAVVDPDKPDRYLLGVECDGSTYRSARSARDRDRLREQVLLGQGWNLFHVWSIDWFQRPAEQFQKLVNAIEVARKNLNKAAPTSSIADVYTIDRQEGGSDPLANAALEPGSLPADDSPHSRLRDVATSVAAEVISKTAHTVMNSPEIRKLEKDLLGPLASILHGKSEPEPETKKRKSKK